MKPTTELKGMVKAQVRTHKVYFGLVKPINGNKIPWTFVDGDYGDEKREYRPQKN